MNCLNYLSRKYKLAKRAKKPYNTGGGETSSVPGIDKWIDQVFPLMTEEEQNLYLCYSMNGSYDDKRNSITMGMKAFEMLEEYEKLMIAKYENTSV